MKVRRYLHGQTNIDLLESGRRAIRSPYEAAGDAFAPYAAVTQVTEALAGAAENIRLEQEELARKEDATHAKLMETERVVAYQKWEQKWSDQPMTQPDGTPTAIAMRKDWEEQVKQLSGGMTRFNSAQRRAEFEQVWNVMNQGFNADVEGKINQRRNQWDEATLYTLFRANVEAHRPAEARSIASELLDKQYVTQDQYDALNNDVRRSEIGMEVDAELQGMREAFRLGGLDGAEAYRNDVIANPHSDSEIQQARLSAVAAEYNNFEVVTQKARETQFAKWDMELNDLINNAEVTGMIDPDQFYEKSVAQGIPPEKAADGRNRLANSYLKTRKDNLDYAETMEYVNQGGILSNNKKNRQVVDRELLRAMEVAPEGATALSVSAEVYKRVGLVGEEHYKLLNNYSSAAQMAAAAKLYEAISDNPYRIPEAGITSTEGAILEAVARRAKNNAMTWEEAAQTVLDERSLPPEKVNQRKIKWEDEGGTEEASDAFEDLVDDFYDLREWRPGVGVELADTEDNRFYYAMHYKDGFDLFGNFEEAQQYANTAYTRSHPITNINGKPEVQRGGLEMRDQNNVTIDWSLLRDKYLTESANKTFDVNGQSVRLDKDKTTLENPINRDGSITYDVYYDGIAVAPTGTGMAETVTFDQDDLLEIRQQTGIKMAQERYRQRMIDLQKELDQLTSKLRFEKKVGKPIDPKEQARLDALPDIIMRETKAARDAAREVGVQF